MITLLTPKLKLKYELHYWDTDVSGSSESDWSSLHLKPIYFPEKMVGMLGEWKYKLAVGGELIVDLGDEDEAIPATVEMQLGKMFSPSFGSYVDVLVGVGDDKPYEWGVGIGVRFRY